MRLATRLWWIAFVFASGVAFAGALCGSVPGDAAAVVAARAEVETTCDCGGSHGSYVACAAGVARTRADSNALRPECRGTVRRCAAKSTCGKPGAVVCCRVRKGVPRCAIARDAGRCGARGGTVDGSTSCCDACGASTTTTTTTATSSTTSTTVVTCETAAVCAGACSGGGTCMSFAAQFCFCVHNFCNGGGYPTCDGSCAAGSFCFTDNLDCRCVPETCSGSACLCVPPQYAFGNCPPGHGLAFCNEVGQSFCAAGPCANVADCPAGDACLDFSACH